MSRVKLLNFICILALFFSSTAYADTYIPVDSLLYDDFRFLEAEGIITTSMLSTLPISRLEGARLTTEALNNASIGNSSRIDRVVSRLEKEFVRELDIAKPAYLKPADTAHLQYAYSDRESFFAKKNRDGLSVRRGNNTFLDLTSRFDSRYVGLAVKPELSIYDDATQLTLKKAYLLANLGREEFMVGKESAWWGPGRNGSILLSTNAEPLTTLKIS
ncbi:MAG: capsule assembly Wzi family protein, partial [Geobacter sp.]